MSKPLTLPEGLCSLYDAMKASVKDAAMGVDKPEACVRMLVLDSIRMYARLANKVPKLLSIPASIEAALQVDRGKNLGFHEKDHGKLRDAKLLFGCRVVWDADEFKVE